MLRILIFWFLFASLNGCAFVYDLSRVKQIPTQLESLPLAKGSFELEKEIKFDLDTGYSKVLRRGTRWFYIGTITQGDVFKTNDQIFTVEGSDIHGAYIVIKCLKLVGFYLSVERTFSPLSNPVELLIREIDLNPY